MVTQDQKEQFALLRADGLSIEKAGAQIGVSHVTALKLNRNLKPDIEQLRQLRMEELYEKAGMLKEARIKAYSKHLKKIDMALDKIDYKMADIKDLLALYLRFMDAINKEYTPIITAPALSENPSPEEIKKAMADLYEQSQMGMPSEQVNNQLKILTAMLDAHKATDAQSTLDAILTAIDKQKLQ